MPFTIAQKLWLPFVLISGLAAVSLVQGWTTSHAPEKTGDYRQSLKLLFDTTDSTLRSLEFTLPCKASLPTSSVSAAGCTTTSVQW